MIAEPNIISIDYDPFVGPSIEKIVPSTEAQQEVWLSCVIGGVEGNLAYNESLALQLQGNIELNIMREALKMLVSRHESLRSSFSGDGTKMIIYEYFEPVIDYFDISNGSVIEQQNQIDEFLKKDAYSPFDLTNGPLLRMSMFKQNDKSCFLNVSAHHIICDGWSFGVLFEDLSLIYNSLCNNLAMSAASEQFSSYAVQSIQFKETPEYHENENYWASQYTNRSADFEITPDFERSGIRTYASRRDDYLVSHSVANRIKKVGAAQNCSYVTTLLSAFEVLLSKFTGHKEIVVGLPAAGQSATGMYNLVGHCVNLLPLKSTVEEALTFNNYLKKRKSETLRDYDHQQYTFGSLLKKINIQRDASRIPLIPVSFNIDIGMDMNVSFEGIEHNIVYNPRVAETFEVFLNVTDVKDGYQFQWSYNKQLYKPSTIKRLMDCYTYLLSQIAENPDQLIENLEIEDQKKILKELEAFNNTRQPLPGNSTILKLLDDASVRYADKTALTYLHESITYDELFKKANQLAHYLISRGIKKGDVVAVAMERGNELVIAILAIVKSGAAFLPLDPQYALERIEYMLNDAHAKILLTTDKYSGRFSSQAVEMPIEKLNDKVKNFPTSAPTEIALAENDLVYILYTSGSTGKPKGVMIENKSLVNYITWAADYYLQGEPSVFPLYTSISFDLTITSVFTPLITGNNILIYEEDPHGFIIEKVFTDNKANVIKLTPSHLKLVKANNEVKKNLPDRHLKLIVGGEELETSLAKDIHHLFNGMVTIYNEYGPTEATVGCMIHRFDPLDASSRTVPIGKPIRNARIYLLDAKLQPVPTGVTGEIYIGGECVARGYFEKDHLTNERFMADPFVAGKKMYKTGDNALITDDNLMVFKGRIDDQVKLRGYRIEPGEIEYHIAKIEGIRHSYTIVREDTPGDQKLVSYIVLNDNAIEDKPTWQATLKKKLPDYMVPAIFVTIPSLPLNANGKVDKAALPKPTVTIKENLQRQLSATELEIKKIWQEEFHINDIAINDDFFEIGGYSLIAVRIMQRIQKHFSVQLPITSMFRNPTIQSIAEVIDGNNTGILEKKVIVPIKTSGTKPPLFIVHGGALNILLYKNLAVFLDDDQPVYGIQALGLDGDVHSLTNLETISACYLKEVLAVEPNGPYSIIGYSLGGRIAFEMARQLLAANKKILFLGILDTYALLDDSYQNNGNVSRFKKKAMRQFKKLAFFSKTFLKYPGQLLKYQSYILKQKLNRQPNEDDDEKIYDYSPEVINAYNHAYNIYEARPIDASIDLFRVEKRIYYLDDTVYLGWKKFAREGISIHPVPGDHKTFLLPPNNKLLAQSIQKAIDKNLAKNATKTSS